MATIKKIIRVLSLVSINSFTLFFSIGVLAQNSPYEVIRLNDGEPIIEPSMFRNRSDGENINGPSIIRVPDWIPENRRANRSAQYYLYFAHHAGDYIRMAWAADIEGPYTLYDDNGNRGDRGVLDNNQRDIILDNNIRIEENHLASPDVIVDNENQRIIMYFHSGPSFFVGNEEVNSQVTWVSTSPYGLEFYDGIESVHFGSSYFRVFEYDNDLYSLDNGARIYRALDADNPWVAPNGHDFTRRLWDRRRDHVFQDAIPLPISELRVRHTGVHVDGNQLQVFYSRRGEFQERIQLSTVDLRPDWEQWDPTFPPIEILTPNPGWEGGQRRLANSETSAGVNVNQLRDPDVFEDEDGQLYLIYSGNGEGGLGIARLYETPRIDRTLITTADAQIRESATNNNFGSLSRIRTSTGSSSSDERTIYMKFDLSNVSNIEHAVVRLFAESTTEGPVTVYETSNNWQENSITAGNAPSLGDVITTTYMTNDNQHFDWNITEYARENVGGVLNLAFDIAPSNNASHEFGSTEGSNPAQLLLSADIGGTNNEANVVQIIKRNATGFALDGGNGGARGQNIGLFNSSNTSENLQWIEIDRGGGFYSYQKLGTNFCIDGGDNGANRQNVRLWECSNNNRNQHWQKVNAGGGAVRLVKRNASGFAINGGTGGANRQNVNLFNSSSSSQNLQWFITPVQGASAKSVAKVTDGIEADSALIYPNPVLSVATIENAANSDIAIYDMSGSLVYTAYISSGSETIDLSNVPQGVYLVEILSASKKQIIKLVKE